MIILEVLTEFLLVLYNRNLFFKEEKIWDCKGMTILLLYKYENDDDQYYFNLKFFLYNSWETTGYSRNLKRSLNFIKENIKRFNL